MSKPIAAAVTLAAACLAWGGPAEAQVMGRGPRVFTGPGGPVALTPGYGYPTASPAAPAAPGHLAPYSYYAAPAGTPARGYVAPDPANYPFYGRPYGHPYDLWTWPTMGSGGYYNQMSRYYYPPLG